MSKEIITYNEHIYQKLELEEDPIDSGRYKVLNRTNLTIYGALDDEANYNETKELINNFSSPYLTNNMIMVLSGAGVYEVISILTSLHTPDYKTHFDAVLEAIKKVGFCVEKPYEANNKIYFNIEKYSGERDTIILEGYTDKVIVIGG